MRSTILPTALIAALVVAAGCGVKKETHQKALDSLKACQGEVSENQRMLDVQKTKVTQLEGELRATQSERDKKSAETLAKEKRIAGLLKEMEDNKSDVEAELLKLRSQRDQANKRLDAYRAVQQRLRSLVDTGKLAVRFRKGQMIIQLPSNVLFASGKGTLSRTGKEALGEVLQILLEFKDRRFQVAGHTDNVPIRSRRFKNNWQLSTARAVSVVEEMVQAGFDANNISASGFGEFDPVVSNETPEGRAQNRRIEIILVPDLSELPNLTVDPS